MSEGRQRGIVCLRERCDSTDLNLLLTMAVRVPAVSTVVTTQSGFQGVDGSVRVMVSSRFQTSTMTD